MRQTHLGFSALLVFVALALFACGDDSVSGAGSSGTESADGSTTYDPTTGLTTGIDDTGDTAPTSLDSTDSGSTSDSGDTDTTDSGSDSGTDTTGGELPDPPVVPGQVIDCGDTIAAAPAGEVCGVTPGSSTLLLQGTVLAGYDVYETGAVLVDASQPNGRILCVGCDCQDTPEAVGATVIACPDGVISPGLINPHDHITFTLSQPVPHGTERYDHRHEWRLGINGATELDTFPGADSSREGVLYGELRNLLGGGTSITGSVGGAAAGDLLRNLDNAQLTGGLVDVDVNYRTFPLGDSDGTLLSTGCSYPSIDGTFNLADDIYLPHISEGITLHAHNEFECLSGAAGGEDLVGDHTSVIHGIGLQADNIDRMGQVGAMLVWSPRSNVDLYGITAEITTYKNSGVRIALGTDWSATGSVNMLRELHCADAFNTDHLDGSFSDVELFMMATYWAAASQGAEDQIGLLATGRIADIAIFDGSATAEHRAIIEGTPEGVSLVLRGGEVLHGDAALVAALVPGAELPGCEPLNVCGTTKRVCAQRDSGLTIAAITAAVNSQAYGLFFCGDPTDEPSCDPARPDEFPDRGGPADFDGDGVDDDDDNCPQIFNPIRPLDQGVQADFDEDGLGDACDYCPTQPGQLCTIPNVFDSDGDGVADPNDNCVQDANVGQEDDDLDGIGDDCDACPTIANPGGSACPATIYEIKDGTLGDGDSVFIDDALVTGVGASGYFVQVHPADADYMGVDFSGLFVYDNGAFAQPAVGDRVDVGGTVNDFFGQLQLVTGGAPAVVSSGNAPPDPEPATVADLIEGGALQAELEGVIVEVLDVTVTDVMPVPGPGDGSPDGEFEVDDALRVNDFFYAAQPAPILSQTYSRIIGIARWANDYTKLEPRSIADYPPSIIAFGVPDCFLLEGSMAEPIPELSVVLSGPATMGTAVALSYEDPSIVTGPAVVNVPIGLTSVPVVLTGVSLGTAMVTATLDGVQLSTSVRVYSDAEARIPTLVPAAINAPLSASVTLTVQLDIPAPAASQTVGLSVGPGTCATVPASVNLPAFSLSGTFDVTTLACEGDEIVTASIAPALSDATVSIIDAPAFGLVLAEVYYDHTSGNDDTNEWVKIYNGTGSAIDLAGYSLGWGGTDYTYGGVDLVGVVAAGECFLVGGPNGDAVSGFPGAASFDQAVNLEPDVQNGGTAGDGVALFDVPFASVGAVTLPIDAVIYGPNNNNGLPDQTGVPGAVDVADAPAERSLRLLSDQTWGISLTPSPLSCVPFADP